MLKFKTTQMEWFDASSCMERAYFAGHEMVSISNTGKSDFVLWYLGFESEPYATMEKAKASAPAFALRVLSWMQQLIKLPMLASFQNPDDLPDINIPNDVDQADLFLPTKAILKALPSQFTNVTPHSKYPGFGSEDAAPDVLCFDQRQKTQLLAILPPEDRTADDQWCAIHKSSRDMGGTPSKWQITGTVSDIALGVVKYLNALVGTSSKGSS
jgi:hypothetical protein